MQFIDYDLKSFIDRPKNEKNTSGSYKYYVTREKSRSIICTVQTTFNDLVRMVMALTCICY